MIGGVRGHTMQLTNYENFGVIAQHKSTKAD
jgi:hypothetical protein